MIEDSASQRPIAIERVTELQLFAYLTEGLSFPKAVTRMSEYLLGWNGRSSMKRGVTFFEQVSLETVRKVRHKMRRAKRSSREKTGLTKNLKSGTQRGNGLNQKARTVAP
jgi:hypothetical protein